MVYLVGILAPKRIFSPPPPKSLQTPSRPFPQREESPQPMLQCQWARRAQARVQVQAPLMLIWGVPAMTGSWSRPASREVTILFGLIHSMAFQLLPSLQAWMIWEQINSMRASKNRSSPSGLETLRSTASFWKLICKRVITSWKLGALESGCVPEFLDCPYMDRRRSK